MSLVGFECPFTAIGVFARSDSELNRIQNQFFVKNLDLVFNFFKTR